METNPAPWQQRYELNVCPASAIDPAIPPAAPGVAVIYTAADAGETVHLVIESRTGSLRALCAKRLQSGKLPPTGGLTIAFKAEPLTDRTPEAVHTACREQIIFAGELRRELRPAMR
jgi:hypothetical protein